MSEWKKSGIKSDKKLWDDFNILSKNSVFVAHNASFEKSFINFQTRKYGVKLNSYIWIDTISLAWPLKFRYNSLDHMLEQFKFKRELKPHNALNGAECCKNVYIKIMEKMKK